MPVETIEWVGGMRGHARMVDQRELPGRFVRINCRTVADMVRAIRTLAVRGAPALGIAAAFGMLLGAKGIRTRKPKEFLRELGKAREEIGRSRPTAVNLFWGLARMEATAKREAENGTARMRRALFEEAMLIRDEDKVTTRRIGRNGARLIRNGDSILTHCNAGGLATADYGTALGVLFRAKEEGKKFEVYVDETRPLLQGARLTTWELKEAGIRATLICDNMAGAVMKARRVNKVLVGADRIAANGDVANKIGTYSVAQLARAHGIPFYVAAPASTFDLTIRDGRAIPIEERSAEEVTTVLGRRIAPKGVEAYNPAFDVTPRRLVTAIITECGVIERPNRERVRRHFGGQAKKRVRGGGI
ncbi:MAG: S-methyl-5-thioribose-1-phosphate isomerase [Planctomycetota bacterium]